MDQKEGQRKGSDRMVFGVFLGRNPREARAFSVFFDSNDGNCR